MHKHLHSQAPVRIFAFSFIATIAAIIGTLFGFGIGALLVTLILIIVEITFSFENAIINAKILSGVSKFWQNIFLTVGIVVAIFGMRVVFPILIVMVTAHLGWSDVLDLALNHPEQYAKELNEAHPEIAAFGGAFLLMLALNFFLDDRRETVWIAKFERKLQTLATFWMPAVLSIAIILVLALLPFNHHKHETITAGVFGILVYTAMHVLINAFEKFNRGSTNREGGKNGVVLQKGMAALMSLFYLEILDASFSFDGVIGAFAVTNEVILIAIGLGVGAIWVRSLTVFMVRNGTLDSYKYLEHGAHYTVFVLAAVLLLGILWEVPEVFAGIVGIGFITAAVISSRQALRAKS